MEKHPLLQIGPQAEILALKFLLVGCWGRVWPQRGQRPWAASEGRPGVVRCQNWDTNRLPASHHHQSCDFTHTSCGNHAFFSVSYFLPIHTSSFCNEIVTPKQILKESFEFSQMMDMFSLFNNQQIKGAHCRMWLPVLVGDKVWEWPCATARYRGWKVAETKSCVCVCF